MRRRRPRRSKEHWATRLRSRDLGAAAFELAARRAKTRQKHYAKKTRRYDWSYYPYWRPYQYRYWQLYYPYGGPLF